MDKTDILGKSAIIFILIKIKQSNQARFLILGSGNIFEKH